MLEIRLTKREHSEIEWFLGVLQAVEALDVRYRTDLEDVMWKEGLSPARRIDWPSIARKVFPALVIVMGHDERRGEKFYEHPAYIIIPRIGICYSVGDDVEFVIEESRSPTSPSVGDALNTLKLAAASLPKVKEAEVLKLSAMIARLFRGEL